ncbi:outer membrane lipoprotein chaperone LolA [Candidatus Hoaglandella endobia]|uniref:Outer-membrane lipoprotein carrier protein n=1 Tax=Candidatus Hoaglandella endobia TaxID=1778263 RepID=A0A143WTU1_9ENTR|nr:outer membrane lipoprotein chaperone LolA [Candidatus Hoaglandella endobia]CUX97173.1 Outer-membrane lipoprotein carrier protein precursor [Candidatus Hoaglandella endobia]
MKEFLITAHLVTVLLASPAFAADAADVLQSRLNKVNSFHASFTQQVNEVEGVSIQEAEGELWVKRPNLFNWHLMSPDENVLISDGKTLWFYNPFVEQVTANWLKNATCNTPLMLIINNGTTDWSQYKVTQQGDNFSLLSKLSEANHSNLRQLTITITANGTIESFTAVEQNGQCSAYQLKSQSNSSVENEKFNFILPEGVTLDDQRQ